MPRKSSEDYKNTRHYIPKISHEFRSPIKEKLRNLEERYIHEGRVVFDHFTDLNYVRSLFHFVEFECLLEINEQINSSPTLFAQILDVPCEGACVFTDRSRLDELAYGIPLDGPYQTNPPSIKDIILSIRIDREGQVRRIHHEEEIKNEYPELYNESYVLYDHVMNPLAAQLERKPRRDRGTRRDPNHLIGECPKPPRDKNQRAFVGGSWSDNGEEDDENIQDDTPGEWIKDSGCSKKMMGNRKLFSTYKAYNGGNVIFGSNLSGNIIGKDSAFVRFNTIITSLKALDEGYSSKNYVRKFLRALHPKWRAKVTAIEESKDLTSLSLDELIGNLKVHEMIIKKDSKIVKAKIERKSLALKAKKESSDEECLTSGSEDKVSMASKLSYVNDQSTREKKNQRAFVVVLRSYSGEENDENIQDETCLVAQAPNEICLGVDLEPEEYIKDSGCSKHMTGNRKLFSIYKEYNGGNVIFGSNLRGNIIGKGNKPKDKIYLATIDENSTLWRRILGHTNMRLIQSLASKELVRNLPKLRFDQHFCDACKIGKQAHVSHKAKNIVSTTRCLELLHMDLFGPSAVRSYGGNRYTLVIVDDYSREFDNEVQFGEFCNANGITHNFSAPRTPQSNGVVERKNRTLQEMSRTMLNEQSLPQKFRCNAVDTSTYILNRILIRAILGKTPYEILRGRKPTLNYFRVFGSKCFILNTKDYLTKFDPKLYEGVFLGYSQNSEAYIILNKDIRKIEESLNVTFDETPPPSKTSPLVDDDLDEE
ncbi:retrovirus-related pol polyprotein from transposon TNT 1-94 [Tanacetum coccineum]|uniref:Retrovirus-related pol polyprotein from transposon TNT 1-94 n=1 Tax=Tanacetum coccineum TaxID=301880 RepID=A0ABQ5H6E5_9ASTR